MDGFLMRKTIKFIRLNWKQKKYIILVMLPVITVI